MSNTFTSSMDVTKPAGTRSKLLGDDDIREFKVQYCERMNIDHQQPSNEAGDGNVGFHRKTTLLEQGSDPTAVADALILYAKLAGSYSELHGVHENAGVQQLTRLGKLWVEALGIASEAEGDILYRDSSKWTRLAKGTASQQLRMNAGATAPEWFTPSSTFTANMVMMWYGTIATIPSGWVFCNGANSTPDLRDKFVVGAKQDDSGAAKSNITGSLLQSGGDSNQPPRTSTVANPNEQDGNDGTPMADANHYHTFTPPFYALAYIMKS